MMPTPFDWQRGPRSSFALGSEHGVYALFLREGVELPGIDPEQQGLLYIGMAANRAGLKGRCHFDARTRNHSPRKSLAVLLMQSLQLTPVLVAKPHSADSWGLDAPSDARLSAWMHSHLDLAIEICADPARRETELLRLYAPPLNLAKCAQTAQHRRISMARADVMAQLRGSQPIEGRDSFAIRTSPTPGLAIAGRADARRHAGGEVDTADAIAARYGLNPKSYRQRLRTLIPWYRKPQDWTFPVESSQWRDMIAVAESMAGRSL